MTSTWPPGDSVLAVDRVDVGLGALLLVVGTGFLYLVAGPAAAFIVLAIYLALIVVFGITAVTKGHRGSDVLPLAARLGLGFVGRWFSFW